MTVLNPALPHPAFTPMDLRQILVLLGSDSQCSVRVQVAARLAAAHGCALEGLAPTGRAVLPSSLGSAAWAIEAAQAARTEALSLAEDQVAAFQKLARARGVAEPVAITSEGDISAVLLHRAACSDLVVISQPAPDSPTLRADMQFVERILTHNPKPTLVVPGQGLAEHVGRDVLVGWDDSPAAIRAVTDALPLLRRAHAVTVCVWHSGSAEAAEGLTARLADVCGWLSQHGVAARPRLQAGGRHIGEAMLQTAGALGADLIVMGTYGHSRWIERIAGGVTRTALWRSPIPLLMSH
jgi:nucleotide-binding universal stress UspA family protein